MALKSVSFRASLLSTTTDVLATVGIDCARTAKFVVDTASSLAAYAEEGQPLSPEVYLCNSIKELVKRAGSGSYIVLGKSDDIQSVSNHALKFGAPLCGSRWSIFVERAKRGRACRYGVFSETGDPAALTAEETLLSSYDAKFPIVMIAQNGTNRVRVTPAGQPAVEFRFNADLDIADLPDKGHLEKVANSIASAKDAGDGAFQAYIMRVIRLSVERSHGTLIAVCDAEAAELPAALTDAVLLDPPLDLFELHRTHLEGGRTAESVSALQSATELVAGFVNSDGITVFDTAGRVRAYRAFVKPQDDQPAVAGGARTRAFAVLDTAVDARTLKAAFFRSQDGNTRVNNGEAE